MPNFVPGVGPSNAKLAIVGEAPGYYEDSAGTPFVGPSGSLLNSFLYDCGISRDDVYITNVVKYRPPNNDFKRVNEVCNYDQQIEMLSQEIKSVQPNCILALGIEAVVALTGRKGRMQDLRGSILPGRFNRKVVASYHPAALLHSQNDDGVRKGGLPYWIRNIVRFDIQRAVEEANSSDYYPPQRNIIIAKSSADIYNFISQNEQREYCAVDIEAPKSLSRNIPTNIAFSFSKSTALVVPLFQRMFGFEICTIPHNDLAECWLYCDKILTGKWKKVGQNFKYDQDKLRRLRFGMKNFHADTMLIQGTLNPEFYKSLAFLTSIYTKQPFYKDEGKDFDPKRDSIVQLFNYGGTDACVTLEIFLEQIAELEEANLTSFYFDYVHLLHNLYLDIENRGLRIDFDQRKKLNDKYKEQCDALIEKMHGILRRFGYLEQFNPRSPKQVALMLYEVLGIPRREGTGEEVLFALLGNVVKDEHKKTFIRCELDYRKAHKTRTTYIEAEPDYDNRMKTSYRICGTETSRTSTAKIDSPIRPDDIGIALQTMTKHGDIGADLRSMYIPDDGFVFLEVDLSQAEPRIVALLSEDDDLMKMFDTIDIHSWTASLVLSIPMNEIKKGSPERHIGKTTRNGGNYDMKKRRLMIETNTSAAKYGVRNWDDISEYRAGQYIDKFHAFTPKVREVFHRDIKEAMHRDRTLINPFNRRRQFWAEMNEQLYQEAYAQLPQSTVGDIVKHAMLDGKKEAPELQILLESHDAILMQVPIPDAEKYARLMIGLLERPVDFSQCTLKRGVLQPKAEAQIGENWKDLKDFKIGGMIHETKTS